MSDLLSVELDQKALARVTTKLHGLQGKGVADKLNRGTLAALKILLPSVRAASPRRTGKLRSSIKVRKASRGTGAVLAPGTPYRHLVIRGHRVVTPGGRYLGRSTKANPFIDAAVQPRMDQAMAAVQKALFDD